MKKLFLLIVIFMGVCGVPRPGFFVYALAYGVNKGLLSADKFMPVIEKGWNALL